MSEFSVGLLYLNEDAEQIDPQLDGLEYITDHDVLNDRWNVVILTLDAWQALAEPGGRDAPTVREPILAVSRQAPLLFFCNAEDHGWGYRLYHRGEETARFDLSYEADYYLAEAALRRAHPGQDVHDVCSGEEWEVAQTQARQSEAYLTQLRNGIANARSEAFRAFGLTDDAIAELRSLLSEASLIEALAGDNFQEPAERFKTLLDIEEMSWLS